MKLCPNCQAELKDTAKFCNECGFNVKEYEEKNAKKVCKSCGATLDGGKYCDECGAPVEQATSNTAEIITDTSSIGGFDFSAINMAATDQLYSKEGFEVENGVLMKYIGKKRSVLIPCSIEEIYDGAFEGNGVITVVEIENGVRFIGKRAFADCSSLISLSVPGSVKKVYDDALSGTHLEELVLDEYDKSAFNGVVKYALSAKAVEYLSLGEMEIEDFITHRNGKCVISIEELENEAEFISCATLERQRQEQENARIAEEKRKAEAARKADEERKAEEKRRAEATKKAEEARRAEKQRQENEEKRKKEAKEAELSVWDKGTVHKFGTYNQGAKGEKMPIEWIVVKRSEKWALVISKYAIEAGGYHTRNMNVTWESCNLRRWLNNEFYNFAFNAEEKSRIGLGTQSNAGNGRYGVSGGNKTEDYVFLFSAAEVEYYMPDAESRMCFPTAYARTRKIYANQKGHCYWWLGTPGKDQKRACQVKVDGEVWLEGDMVSSTNAGIRPVMWISI